MVRARLAELRRSLPETFWLVWLGTLINRAGGFVLPMLGYYLTDERGLPRGTAVIIGTCYGAGAMIAGLIGGVLADRIGRKRTMVLSLLGGAVALLALSEARGAAAIGAAAAALGVVGEVYRPAVMAFVADVVPAPQRPRAFAALYWAINLGFTIAPLAAGALASWSYRALFIADAATMAIYGVIVAVRLPATPPLVVDDDSPRVSLTTVLRDRVFLAFVVLTFAVGLVFHQSTMTLSVHLEHAGYAASTYGAIVAVNGALIILVQPWLAAWAAGKDSTRVLAIAAVLAGLGMGLHGADDAVVVQVIAVVVWTTGEILQSPFFGTVVSTLAPPEARGRYQGVFAVAFGTAAMAAPSTGQAAVAVGGVRGPWLLCAILGVAAAVGLLATARGRRARGVR